MTCCIGLIYFRITYDPVELWTTPTSQSRINKVTRGVNVGK